MGITSITFYIVLTLISANALADSIAFLSCANDDEVGGLHARLREQLPIKALPGGCT